MPFYDRFLDIVEDIYHERQYHKRTRDKRRYSDNSPEGYRYTPGQPQSLRKKNADDDDDLSRYSGLYREVKQHTGEDDGNMPPAYMKRIGDENDPYADGFAVPRGLSPFKRREYIRAERQRLAGANRPGHIYDGVFDDDDIDTDRPDDNRPYEPRYQPSERREHHARSSRNIRMSHDRYDRSDPYDRSEHNRRRYRPERGYERYGSGAPSRYPRSYEDDYSDYPEYTNERPKRRRMGLGGKLLILAVVVGVILAQVILFGSFDSTPPSPVDIESQGDYAIMTPPPSSAAAVTEQELSEQAAAMVSAMSSEQKIGHLIITSTQGLSGDSLPQMVSATDAGGVLLRASDIEGKSKSDVAELISSLKSVGRGGRLIILEEEGGSRVTLSSSSKLCDTPYRTAQALYVRGGMELIRSDTVDKCNLLKEMGVSVNLAPLCDTVTDTGAFMFSRSFGHDAQLTSEYTSLVTSVMKENGVGSVLKYFPGYGNSTGDTRNGLVVIRTAATVIRERDLLPFKAGVEAGADSVMISHAIVTALDDQRPASMSPAVIGLLRDELGFDGVIMTEELDSPGLGEFTGGVDTSVTMLCSGVDVILAPPDSAAARFAINEAVLNGTLSQERLDEAVTRIIYWKLRLGLLSADG